MGLSRKGPSRKKIYYKETYNKGRKVPAGLRGLWGKTRKAEIEEVWKKRRVETERARAKSQGKGLWGREKKKRQDGKAGGL